MNRSRASSNPFAPVLYDPESYSAQIVSWCMNPTAYQFMLKIIRYGQTAMEYKNIIEALTMDEGAFTCVIQDKQGSLVIQEAIDKLAYACNRYEQRHISRAMGQAYLKSVGIFEFELLDRLMTMVYKGSKTWINHPVANYILASILKSNFLVSEKKKIILDNIINNVLSLSQLKYASHIVELAIKYGSPKCLELIAVELLKGYAPDSKGRTAIVCLMFDKYGNYVLQSMLKVLIDVRHGLFPGDAEWFMLVATEVFANSTNLRQYTSGKSILRLVQNELETRWTHGRGLKSMMPMVSSSTNTYRTEAHLSNGIWNKVDGSYNSPGRRYSFTSTDHPASTLDHSDESYGMHAQPDFVDELINALSLYEYVPEYNLSL